MKWIKKCIQELFVFLLWLKSISLIKIPPLPLAIIFLHKISSEQRLIFFFLLMSALSLLVIGFKGFRRKKDEKWKDFRARGTSQMMILPSHINSCVKHARHPLMKVNIIQKNYGVLPFNKYGELDFECETKKYKKYKRFKGKLYLILLIYG